MAEYRFVTRWRLEAPVEVVWDALCTPERYPEWWPCYKERRILTPELTGVGHTGEYVVRGFLPHDVRYRTVLTQCDPPHELAYDASGDLVGDGRFVLRTEGAGTLVTFYWNVRTAGFWANLFAPALKWLFAANTPARHSWSWSTWTAAASRTTWPAPPGRPAGRPGWRRNWPECWTPPPSGASSTGT
jgi:hypothetical protein